MDMLGHRWGLLPPPENAGYSPKAFCERSIHHLHEKKGSMTMQKSQSKVDSLRNLINESRRLDKSLKNVLTEFSGGQSVLCKQNLFVTHLDKNKEISWEFTVKTNNKNNTGPIHGLKNVFFLEKDCSEFSFSSITCGVDNEPLNIRGSDISFANYSHTPVTFAKICVKFCSSSYGHFNVTIIFDFGFAPRIVRYVGAVVAPEKHLFEKLSLLPTTTSDGKHNELSWIKKYKLVSFDDSTTEDVSSKEYSLPANLQYGVEFGAFEYMDVNLTREIYRDRLHNLLFVEEYERRKRMSRLNVHCHDIFTVFGKRSRLQSMRTVDVNKALFIPVSEQTLEEVGILITRGSKALIRLRQFVHGVDCEDYVIHEALVISILSGEIILEISSKTLTLVKTLTSPVAVDICFRFVNTFHCMHSAIDRVNLDLLFYQPLLKLVREKSRNLVRESYSLLSPTQAAALSRIIHSSPGPPVLLLGPFGTGKTQTVAEAIKVLVSQQKERCRILICTHSNSAADHYIEDYLQKIFKDMNKESSSDEKLLRLYWEHRLAASISDTMLPYCIMNLNTGTFRDPTLDELARKTVIVTTLVTADMLVQCGVKPGFFTHIFIDEAAQAMEVETLIPLSLATEDTKVVLAGDHLQLSPPVFSSIGRKLLLDKSLLVRLYESYPASSSRKILLLENFRSYPEIVNIPSKLFYEGSLVSRKQLPNDLQYPVKFYGVHGLEEKAKDSPSYVNMAEVAEITERIEEMVNRWPKQHFGELQLEKTCVLSAHYAQIRQIRRDLRVNGFSAVRVENVNNVQGLEFDVLFLSTVRTSRMLSPGQHEGKDLGFLSNPKLLNTAITRAKFCLVIIGDPKALCSVGDCRVCWKTILSLCSENGTFNYRAPLKQVLSSIREEQIQTMPQNPYQRQYVPPLIPNQFPLFPVQMGTAGQAPPVFPMTSALYPSGYNPPIIPAALSPPVHNQSPLHIPAALHGHVGSHVNTIPRNIYNYPQSPEASLSAPPAFASTVSLGNYVTRGMRNTYSERELMLQRTSPPRPSMPTPRYYSSEIRLPPSIFTVESNIPNSNRNVQGSTEVNVRSTSSESAVLRIPPDGVSETPVHAGSYYQIEEKHVTNTTRNLRSTLKVALPAPLSTKSMTSSPSDSKHEHPNHNRSFSPYKESSSATNRDSDFKNDALRPNREDAGSECTYPGNIFGETDGPTTETISPTQTAVESPTRSLSQTLRQNIASSLRTIAESEEAASMFIENPTEDIPIEIKENIFIQISLLQKQKSSLEEQLVLNRTLAKMFHSLEEKSKRMEDMKGRVLIDDYLSSSPRLTHVCKINFDSDSEVQEWHRLRRQDPIVQDYIRSFEMLSERARTRVTQSDQITESCDISGGDNSNLVRSLRGWVLQPQSVVYPSGNSFYEEHFSAEEVGKKLENGELVSCTLSVDRSSSGKSATCVVDDPLEKNIVIPDRQSMNRALNTDYVAVEITHDVEDDDVREGKVVAILQERHHRQVVCRLASLESTVMIPLNNTNPKFSILQSDNHVGQTGVAVFNTQGDQIHFQHFVSDVQDKLFLVQFLKWDVSYRYPLGFVARCFVQDSDLSSLIPVLCSDYGILNHFPNAVTEEIEAHFPQSWQVPDVELKSRCRYEDAFTIDSEGAEELDDAISVRPVKYGVYSVTIHVADVSYLVKKASLVDKAAQERATSLYVGSDLSLPMLPKQLSDICSLQPGKERLAVSVEFVIDLGGNILMSPIFRRSIVVSQRQLSFEEVDNFLSGQETTPSRTASPLLRALQVLYCLSRELRMRRVRAGSFQACADALIQSASRRIVEELMIITNMAVAKKLSNFPDSHTVPFRMQQSPKYRALQSLVSWADENNLNLSEMWLTQFLAGIQEQESSRSAVVCLDLRIWQGICQKIKFGNMADLTEEILSLHRNSPIIAQLQRQLPKSKYVSSSQYSSTERRHFALDADCYTHFTSPIRRYFDIVVHRVLFSETILPVYDDHEIEELCNMLNLRCGNAAAFSKHCSIVREAESLRGTDGWRTMEITTVDNDSMTLKNINDTKISSLHKVKTSDMGATMCEDGVKQFVITWTCYMVDLSKDNVLENHFQTLPIPGHSSSIEILPRDLTTGQTDLQRFLSRKESFHSSKDVETKTFLEISGERWIGFLQAIKKEDVVAMVKSMETINKHTSLRMNNKPSSERNDKYLTVNTFGCNVVKRAFERGDKLPVFFTCSSTSLPQPLLQAMLVLPEKVCCIQHHRQPVECFCEKAKMPTRERYSSAEEYQRINIPLLMIESAERSVRAKIYSIHIKNVEMKWRKDISNVIHGQFNIPVGKLSPTINLHKNDFVCVSTVDTFSHGCIEDFVIVSGSDHHVQVVLNSAYTTNLPETVNVEIIPQCLKYRRMITAVRNLAHSTEDVRSMFLTRELHSSVKQSRTKRPFMSSFNLDPSQRKALDKAIQSSVTIIDGQSGTGKTYCAAAIAEQFYLENSHHKPLLNLLLCSPTEQAINDAEVILSRVPTVRILRVYDREIEAESFPEMAAVYNVHPRSSTTGSLLQKTALHFKIRSNSNPFNNAIQKYSQQLRNMLQQNTATVVVDKLPLCKVVEEYKKMVDMAEEYELTESGVNIILCTCVGAGSLRIRNHARIKQCIIDESHHCLEAESLIALQAMRSHSDRVVLLGDSRMENVPVVENKLSRSFGLNKSLFHSLRNARGKKKLPQLVLEVQHRMLGL